MSASWANMGCDNYGFMFCRELEGKIMTREHANTKTPGIVLTCRM
jgi:hypothetical protein